MLSSHVPVHELQLYYFPLAGACLLDGEEAGKQGGLEKMGRMEAP